MDLTARPFPMPDSSFAELMASIGAKQIRKAYSSPPPRWETLCFVITPEPSIGRKRRARRQRGRQRAP
jgi:hypothetical protein